MPQLKNITPRLKTPNLHRAIEFYAEALGFRPCVLWPDDQPTFCLLERNGVQLGFAESPETLASNCPASPELYFEVEHVSEWHAALKEKVTIEWGLEVYSYDRREFAFRDPDGNLIILSEPTDEPPTCTLENE